MDHGQAAARRSSSNRVWVIRNWRSDFQDSIEARRVQRSKSVALDFSQGAGDRFAGRRMHFGIGRKRIARLGWIKVLKEELGQEMRLVHLVGASAESKKFDRQIAETTLAACFPMSRQLHAVVHRVRRRGDQIFRRDRSRCSPRVEKRWPGKERAAL